MAWVDFDKVKPYLTYDNATSFSTDEQDFINRLCDAVCKFIENYCGRVIERKQVTEYIDGNVGNTFMLSNFPISNFELYYDPARKFEPDTKLIENKDYFVDLSTGFVHLSFIPTEAPKVLKAIYEAGWETNEIPSDLIDAACQFVVYKYDKIRKNEYDLLTKAGQGASVTFIGPKEDIPPNIKSVLDLYKIF